MRSIGLLLSCVVVLAAAPSPASDGAFRTLVVRERATASLVDDSFTFRVMKLRGYSVDIMLADGKRTLKLDESFGPAKGGCTVIFHEISPETRIARFRTNCP